MTARSIRRFEERAARILLELAPPGCRLGLVRDPQGSRYTFAGECAAELNVEPELVEAMLARDLLVRDARGVTASETGRAFLRRRLAGEDGWRGQHLATETASIEAPDGVRTVVAAVVNESPLAWLRRRLGADGRPMVSDVQFAAGERLRADFERGRLGPRVTADWTRPAMDRNRRGGGGVADLADSALAARRRVDAAMSALGPDLGGLLIDVCCFLCGLEDAERRRSWPRRSAKVVLGIALDRLAAHYGLSETATGPSGPGRLRHWGDADYRPRVDTDALS